MGVQAESPLAWSPDGARFAYVGGDKSIIILTVSNEGRESGAGPTVEMVLHGKHTQKVTPSGRDALSETARRHPNLSVPRPRPC